jgi:ribosomal protein S18 acetylase RimI-like enzyme
VDQSFKGRGMGEDLLFDGLKRSLGIGESLGIHVIEVNAIDEMAAAFYRKYGFMPLTDNPRHLYLPMATVEQVCGPLAKP